MANFSENIVNQRFQEVYERLKEDGQIKSKSDIATHLGTYNHVINSILKGKRNITLEQMNKLVESYKVNANYLFGRSDEMFAGEQSSDLPSLSIAEKIYGGRNNITLVPQKAMAGYAVENNNPAYLEKFQKFSVPNVEGQLIAFEISGDSMLPNITNGDIVVCEPLERGNPLKDNGVYVIVTDTVVAKRVQQIKESNELTGLRLISDNGVIYPPYTVELEEVAQILKVKCRLSTYGIS